MGLKSAELVVETVFEPIFGHLEIVPSLKIEPERVKEAVSEIRKVARSDKVLAAEGAISFLERVSPALEHVDSSSGAIGTAVNNAVLALVEVIARAAVDRQVREKWLERLWEA